MLNMNSDVLHLVLENDSVDTANDGDDVICVKKLPYNDQENRTPLYILLFNDVFVYHFR